MSELARGNHDAGRRSTERVSADHDDNRQGLLVDDLGRVNVQVEAVLVAVDAVIGIALPAGPRAVVGQVGAVPAVLEAAQRLGRAPASLAHGRHGVRHAAEHEGVLLDEALEGSACGLAGDLAVADRLGHDAPGPDAGDADYHDDEEQDEEGRRCGSYSRLDGFRRGG